MTFNLHLRTNPRFSGEFNREVTLYSDAAGRERIPLRIGGKIVPAAKH